MAPALSLFAADPRALDAIGAALADHLVPGEVVALEGDLGTGKTALARAIIRARLGDPALEVPSPTFALVQPYPGLVHADLYRIATPGEVDELGLFDDETAIVLVEWPDRAPRLSGMPGLTVSLEMGPDGAGRDLTIVPRGGRALDALAAALARFAPTRRGGADG